MSEEIEKSLYLVNLAFEDRANFFIDVKGILLVHSTIVYILYLTLSLIFAFVSEDLISTRVN